MDLAAYVRDVLAVDCGDLVDCESASARSRPISHDVDYLPTLPLLSGTFRASVIALSHLGEVMVIVAVVVRGRGLTSTDFFVLSICDTRASE